MTVYITLTLATARTLKSQFVYPDDAFSRPQMCFPFITGGTLSINPTVKAALSTNVKTHKYGHPSWKKNAAAATRSLQMRGPGHTTAVRVLQHMDAKKMEEGQSPSARRAARHIGPNAFVFLHNLFPDKYVVIPR